MDKNKLQDIAFAMIGIIGKAKYQAMNAYKEYRQDQDQHKLTLKLKAAEKELGKVGKIHLDVVSAEAAGKEIEFSSIFMHAEDQFMTVQMMIEMLMLISGA